MDIWKVLELIGGLCLCLFGMSVMGDGLERAAGKGLKGLLAKLTNSKFKGFLTGLGITAVIQSSSATTVMVVGFVNSGVMTLKQSIGVIMGANVGTAVTSWLTALSGIGDGAEVVNALKILKPSTWLPLLAVAGIGLLMFTKRGKKRDIGCVLLGFAVLMTGMSMMSDAVGPLKDNEAFKSILTAFSNPVLGILAGLVLTAIVQSSSASVGILQALTVTGAITYGAAIPIVMGQNIGTCVTAMLSSLGANKNGKRAAVVHLSFNVIGVAVVSVIFYAVNAFVDFAFTDVSIDAWGVALVHTLFKIICVALIGPFYKQLAKLSELIVKDKSAEVEKTSMLDERLLDTPTIAVESATHVAVAMSEISCQALCDSLTLFDNYDAKLADAIRDAESRVDLYEDTLGSYLVKVSACDLAERDSIQVTKLLHIIGDLERISDHAVNIVESAEEIREKKLTFSPEATRELSVLRAAIDEIVKLTHEAFSTNHIGSAVSIEPLEQVVDALRDKIKLNHVLRLQKSECSIEHGFILSDLLTNLERVSDHCSNIGGCVVEISTYEALDMHKYLESVKHGSPDFDAKFSEYSAKYSI